MANHIETYGHVHIFEVISGHYFYQIAPDYLEGKKGTDLIDIILSDDTVEEVMYIGESKPIKIYHGKYGMCNTNVQISENEAQIFIADVAVRNNKIINHSEPMLDATLADGSRLNATLSPASVDGSTFTIRKFKSRVINILDLLNYGTLTVEMAAFLWTCVEGLNMKPANIIFSGGTGSGKTTNLNALSMFIPFDSRIITIEDTPELQLVHEHLVRLTVVPNTDATMERLLTNTLRMRPDRIVVGEVRSEEAKTLFTAMNTGHEGCMGTLHANTTQETLTRITEDPMAVPISMLSGLDLIVMQQRIISGKNHYRRITEISEIAGTPSGKTLPKFNILFKYNASKNTAVKTGVPSRIREKISKASGILPKQFDEIIKRRESLLRQAMDKKIDQKQLLNMIVNHNGTGA